MKRKAFFVLMVLALVVGLTIPMALPAMAATANGSVTPNTVANDGASVLQFTWDI
jgi:hypothetical protein